MSVSRETLWEGKSVAIVPVDRIRRCRYQARRHFDQASLNELAESIKLSSLLQPIVIRKLPDGTYEIIAGERRWRAVQIAGFDSIPAIVMHGISDQKAAELSLVENICRDDISVIEEAEGFQRLSNEFNLTRDEIAKRVGCSRTRVSNTIRLLQLPEEILELLSSAKLDPTHGRVLLSEEAKDLSLNKLIDFATRCVTNQWSSRQLEAQVKSSANKPEVHQTDRDVENLTKAVSDYFCTPVNIQFSKKSQSGKLEIDFNSLSILQGILKKANFDIDSMDQ